MVSTLAVFFTFVQVVGALPPQPTCRSYGKNATECRAHNCSMCGYDTMCYDPGSDMCCGQLPYPTSVCHRSTHSCAFGSHQANCCDNSKTQPCGMDELTAKGFDFVQDGVCIPKDATCCGNLGGMMPNYAFGCKKGSTCCAGGWQSLCCDDATEVCVPATAPPESPKCVNKSVVV